MNILLIGSGGREHSLAWALNRSEKCEKFFCAPGNAGIEDVAECIDIDVTNIDALLSFARKNDIGFVVVGPEAPLVAGIADIFGKEGIPVFGPNQRAAILEGSKSFVKNLCSKYGIPTAAYGQFDNIGEAIEFIEKQPLPIVIKADGLAAGKGVIICETVEDAKKAATDMLSGESFGDAGKKIIVEEFMEGEELSFFALSDGKTTLPFTSAQDYKRVYDEDKGPNTGGMGAYSPARMMSDDLQQKIMDRIITPTVNAMKEEGREYSGVLYAGLMLVNGEPKLVEYNARFGDPECQPMLMRLETDLVELLLAVAEKRLHEFENGIKFFSDHTLCVVMAAKGYPGSYEKGTVIKGLADAENTDGVIIFHAGTTKNDKGELVNSGGRVLNIVAKAENILNAKNRAYEAVEKIDWPEGFCRTDIGLKAI